MPSRNSKQFRESMANGPKPKPDALTSTDQMQPAMDADPTGDMPAGAESLASMHDPGGKHMHISSDGMGGYRSSHVGEDGQPQGPDEHPDLASLTSHMQQVLDDEGAEAYPDDEQAEGESPMRAPAHRGAY